MRGLLLQLEHIGPAVFWIFSGVFSVVYLLAFIVLDANFALSLNPVWLTAYTLIGALPWVVLFVLRPNRIVAGILALFLSLMLISPWLSWGPRKAFLRTASAVQPGMRVQAADQIMQDYDRFPSEPGSADSTGTVVYVNEFGPGDQDALVLTLNDDTIETIRLVVD